MSLKKIESLKTFWATKNCELLRQSDTAVHCWTNHAKLLKIAELQENFSCAETLPKMLAFEQLWRENVKCLAPKLRQSHVDKKPRDVKELRICWDSLFSRMKDFCESKELFNANIHWCFIRFNLIIVPSSSLQSWLSPSASSSSCQIRKVDNLPKANQPWLYKCYMFLVDILSSTKLWYLVCCTTWYFVRQNIQFVVFC